MSEKRELLIQTALDLFYTRGINSVGINEIIKESGVAKKTLYKYFASKNDLVIATLKQRDEAFLSWLTSLLRKHDNGATSVIALFEGLTLWFNNAVPELANFRGCYFINSSVECSDEDNPVGLYCKEHKDKVRELVRKNLGADLHHNETLLDAICLLKEGAIVTALVSKDRQAAAKCIPILSQLMKPV